MRVRPRHQWRRRRLHLSLSSFPFYLIAVELLMVLRLLHLLLLMMIHLLLDVVRRGERQRRASASRRRRRSCHRKKKREKSVESNTSSFNSTFSLARRHCKKGCRERRRVFFLLQSLFSSRAPRRLSRPSLALFPCCLLS